MITWALIWGVGAVVYALVLYPNIKEQEVLSKTDAQATGWTVVLSLLWPLMLAIGAVIYVVAKRHSSKED